MVKHGVLNEHGGKFICFCFQIPAELQVRPTNLKIHTPLVLSFTYAPTSIHKQRLSGCKARGIRHKV